MNERSALGEDKETPCTQECRMSFGSAPAAWANSSAWSATWTAPDAATTVETPSMPEAPSMPGPLPLAPLPPERYHRCLSSLRRLGCYPCPSRQHWRLDSHRCLKRCRRLSRRCQIQCSCLSFRRRLDRCRRCLFPLAVDPSRPESATPDAPRRRGWMRFF
jgi:hypothetical protein